MSEPLKQFGAPIQPLLGQQLVTPILPFQSQTDDVPDGVIKFGEKKTYYTLIEKTASALVRGVPGAGRAVDFVLGLGASTAGAGEEDRLAAERKRDDLVKLLVAVDAAALQVAAEGVGTVKPVASSPPANDDFTGLTRDFWKDP